MFNVIRRIKILHGFYNILNYRKLNYQRPLYDKYGLKKSLYSSISSKDLPADSLTDHPWLDYEDSNTVLPRNTAFKQLPNNRQQELLNWSQDGFAIFKGFYSKDKVKAINSLFQELRKDKQMPIKDNRKIMHAVSYSKEMKDLVNIPELLNILELLMGRKVDLFQSVNFLQGSEDPAHSDFIHMSTYPYGYLIAVWIALEDINEDNGPLFYYPGSHKLPYTMNKDFSHGGNRWFIGKNYKREYAKKIVSILEENHFEKRVFTAKKGDVLIWHANMLHGGSQVKNKALTRKSMVLHYFGQDVIRYHEVSERPSLASIEP